MLSHRLIVLRHAKSDWESDARSDHERPLNERGQKEAPVVGQRLVARDWIPQRVFSSDAVRTRETWALLAPGLQRDGLPPIEVEFTSEFYLAGLEMIRRHVPRTAARTVMVIGHNPGWEMMVASLTGRSVTMKTAYAALLEGVGDDWRSVLSGSMRLVELLTPR